MVARGMLAAKCNTANAERDFSDLTRLINKNRAAMCCHLKELERRLRLAGLELSDMEKNQVCREAQRIWAAGFQPPRLAGSKRGSNWSSGRKLLQKHKDME
jgi:hypothetical protein